MATEINLPIGARIQLPGHFDAPVILEDARPLPNGYECHMRLADDKLEETARIPRIRSIYHTRSVLTKP
jgi:hypothetical protein